MVQLLPVTEQAFIERLNKIYHTHADQAYVCVEKKEIKASILYRIDRKKKLGNIQNVSTVEADIFDGLVRAVFAAMLEQDIHQAEFDAKTDLEMITKLGFVQDGSFFVESIDEIIHNRKNCKKN